MDMQISEFSRVSCTYKSCPTGHTYLHDVNAACPKMIYVEDQERKKRFSLGKRGGEKEVVLVAWDKLCKPKTHGGLWLHDPETLSRVSGGKLWWRWLKESTSPWAKLWKQKYSQNWLEKDHIRMSGVIKGSHI